MERPAVTSSKLWLLLIPVVLSPVTINSSLSANPAAEHREQNVDAYLKDGLEIIKFGMTLEQINEIIPSPEKTLSWEQLKQVNIGGKDFRMLTRGLTQFNQLRYLWEFSREQAIFLSNPCFSRKTSLVTFLFYDRKLVWIHLEATDAPDCPSHEPLFEAIATFYRVKTVRREFSGLGVWIRRDGGHIKIKHVLETSPAFQAGIRSGDELLFIDGRSLGHASDMEIVAWLRGPEQSRVALTLQRESGQPLTLGLTRALITDGTRFDAHSNVVCLSGVRASDAAIVEIRQPIPGITCASELDVFQG
jgi:hypothetical protein